MVQKKLENESLSRGLALWFKKAWKWVTIPWARTVVKKSLKMSHYHVGWHCGSKKSLKMSHYHVGWHYGSKKLENESLSCGLALWFKLAWKWDTNHELAIWFKVAWNEILSHEFGDEIVSERANQWSPRSAQAKRTLLSKQMSNEWPLSSASGQIYSQPEYRFIETTVAFSSRVSPGSNQDGC